MVLMARKRETSRMTEWGYYFSALLKERHFDNLTQFSEELHERGRGVTPQMISKYRRQTPPLWFVADSIEVLELSEEESNKFLRLWLETLPEDERAVHEKMAALLLRGSGENDPRYPGGAESEEDFEQGLEAEESVRKRRNNDRGESGTGAGGTPI